MRQEPRLSRAELEELLSDISTILSPSNTPVCSLGDLKDFTNDEDFAHVALGGTPLFFIETVVFIRLKDGEMFCAPTMVTPLFSDRYNVLLSTVAWGDDAKRRLADAEVRMNRAQTHVHLMRVDD